MHRSSSRARGVAARVVAVFAAVSALTEPTTAAILPRWPPHLDSLGRRSEGLGARADVRHAYPSVDNFLRYPYSAAIVLGDRLYIDGGEVSQLYDGEDLSTVSNGTYRPSYPVNATYSIDLSKSWKTSEVEITPLTKYGPILNAECLFSTANNASFFSVGGAVYPGRSVLAMRLWELETSNDMWTLHDDDGLSSLYSTFSSAHTQRPDGSIGWMFGGYSDSGTDKDWTGMQPMPGIIEFDMETASFTNISSEGMGKYGTMIGGQMEYVPFGEEGMLVMLGGYELSVVTPAKTNGVQWLTWDTLTLWDIKEQTFHKQATTGERPDFMQRFCTVGVQGPDNTYEIFIYGGLGGGYTIGDVYILSLPGFRFFKANGASSSSAQSTLRADHACARVSASQMISVGGTDGWLGFPDSLMDADPWPRGMALFDLNAAQWTDTYDPALGPYRGPQEVRDWYDGGGLDSVTWNTEKMMEMFASGTEENLSDQPGGQDGSGGDSSTAGSKQSSSHSNTPIGAVIGGTLGAVAIIGMIVVGIVYFFRRRKRRAVPVTSPSDLDANGYPLLAPVSGVFNAPMGYASDGSANYTPSMGASHMGAPDLPLLLSAGPHEAPTDGAILGYHRSGGDSAKLGLASVTTELSGTKGDAAWTPPGSTGPSPNELPANTAPANVISQRPSTDHHPASGSDADQGPKPGVSAGSPPQGADQATELYAGPTGTAMHATHVYTEPKALVQDVKRW